MEVLNAKYYPNSKLNLWAESQLRSQKIFQDFYYHELKGGLNVRVKKDFAVLFGVWQYRTYTIGGNFKSPVIAHEFRLWEQLTHNNNISA